jgi:hypothetical protein
LAAPTFRRRHACFTLRSAGVIFYRLKTAARNTLLLNRDPQMVTQIGDSVASSSRISLSIRLHFHNNQRIACAAAAARVFRQDAFGHEIVYVAQSRILRTLCKLRPFRRGEFAFETLEKTLDYRSLAIVEFLVGMLLAEACLPEDRGKDRIGAIEGAVDPVFGTHS